MRTLLLATLAAVCYGQAFLEHNSKLMYYQYPAGWQWDVWEGAMAVASPDMRQAVIIRTWDAAETECLHEDEHPRRVNEVYYASRNWNGGPEFRAPGASRYGDGWSKDVINVRRERPGGPTMVTEHSSKPGYASAAWQFVSYCTAGKFVLVEFRFRPYDSQAFSSREMILNSLRVRGVPPIVGTWTRPGDECNFHSDGRYVCLAVIFGSSSSGKYKTSGNELTLDSVNGRQTCPFTVDGLQLAIRCGSRTDVYRRQ